MEGILRALVGVKRAVVALVTSLGEVEYNGEGNGQDKIVLGVVGVYSPIDAQVLEGLVSRIKRVRQFWFDPVFGELDVAFDPQVISSRSLVDGINLGSNYMFKLHVRNPYTRLASKDGSETSAMLRLFISSLFLSK
ncbi:hypothetical protein RJT34_26542 [Clitoria ternatea]|uniref:Uncharacterized protein n=1 Tax=Clitoria ternatea TaxID=43366 RepID=A0AAN9IAK5_CLITE